MCNLQTVEPDPIIYQELTAKIKTLEQNSFALGGHLAEMARERHYLAPDHTGQTRYETFEDFCVGELRYTKSAAYTLIRAHTCYEILREYQCERLPINPFTVRPLSRLDTEEEIVTAWEQACAQKNADKLPSKDDVERVVRQMLNPKPTRESRRAADKYASVLTKATRELRDIMRDLEFRRFLKSKNPGSQKQKEELAKKLTELVCGAVLHHMMITGHMPKRRRIITPKSIELVTAKEKQAIRYKF
jgi:hypothetical protein